MGKGLKQEGASEPPSAGIGSRAQRQDIHSVCSRRRKRDRGREEGGREEGEEEGGVFGGEIGEGEELREDEAEEAAFLGF